jgi:hypothetical protein
MPPGFITRLHSEIQAGALAGRGSRRAAGVGSHLYTLESLAPLIAFAATQRGELAAEERAILEANPGG